MRIPRHETTARAHAELLAALPLCVERLGDWLLGIESPTSAQVRAISLVLDRALGKAPERIEVSPGPEPWQAQLAVLVAHLGRADVTPGDELGTAPLPGYPPGPEPST